MIHVIDDFAPLGLVRALDATWLPHNSPFWHIYDNGKRATKDPSRLPVAAHLLLHKMAEVDVSRILDKCEEAFPDVEYLHGAGLHQIDAGGSLGLHLDSERHPVLPWRRAASGVLYLDDCDGGEFLLCDEYGSIHDDGDSVACVRNRLVLFSTPGTWHRVATVNSGVRRSVCLFWWTLGTGTGATQATFRE